MRLIPLFLCLIAIIIIPSAIDRTMRNRAYDTMSWTIRECERDVNRCGEAIHFYHTRCLDKQDGEACFSLGLYYVSGHGLERDVTKAKTLFDRSCRLGEKIGCKLAVTDYPETLDK